MERKEIQEKYKWNIYDIFPSDEAFEEEFATLKDAVKEIASFKGKLNDRDTLLKCLKLYDSHDLKLSVLYRYAGMQRDTDSRNSLYVGMTDRVLNYYTEYMTASSFISSEISSLDSDYLNRVIEDRDFKDFDFFLKELVRVKKYILPEKEERLLAMSTKGMQTPNNAFTMLTNVDLVLPTLTLDNKQQKLTHGLYGYYLAGENREDRKAVFTGMYSSFKTIIHTLTALYAGSVACDNFKAKARGFSGCLEKAMYMDNIPKEVYENLIKTIEENQSYVHEYVALRKKALGFDKMHMYDMYVPIVKGVDMRLDYETAYQEVIKGLAPLGNEYKDLLIKAKEDRWIDVYESEGKRSGAYAGDVYTAHPYVMLNHSNSTHDLFTIAHELGHAMHSYYSSKTQPYSKSNYQIFVAEVASTVNEVLLLKYQIQNAKTNQEKAFFLNYYLDMFRTTVFRQTMFAQFEYIAHEMDLNNEPLTVENLCEKYLDLNRKYYGESVEHDDEIKYEWARIPHFYEAFYVYKYSTGLISAVNIASKILSDPSYIETYKNKFLCAGGSDSPYNILKNTGVDLAKKQPFEIAMKEFKATLDELTKTFK